MRPRASSPHHWSTLCVEGNTTLTSKTAPAKEKPPTHGRAGEDQPVAEKQVHIRTMRFGEMTIDAKLIITVPKGLLGFESSHRYVIIETTDSEPFKWFQSLDDSALAFVIVNPLVFFVDYRIDVDPRELKELSIADRASVMTYVIVSVPDGDLSRMSVNLQGPIIICTENNLAKQLVMVSGPYSTSHSLVAEIGNTAGQSSPESKAEASPG